MKKSITFFKRSILAAALILASVNAQSQTPYANFPYYRNGANTPFQVPTDKVDADLNTTTNRAAFVMLGSWFDQTNSGGVPSYQADEGITIIAGETGSSWAPLATNDRIVTETTANTNSAEWDYTKDVFAKRGQTLFYTVNFSAQGDYKIYLRHNENRAIPYVVDVFSKANMDAPIKTFTLNAGGMAATAGSFSSNNTTQYVAAGGGTSLWLKTVDVLTIASPGDYVIKINTTGALFRRNFGGFTIFPVPAAVVAEITLTKPIAPGAAVAVISGATLKALAKPAGGKTISKVEFFEGENLLGEGTLVAGFYEFNWIPTATGSYVISAKLTESDNTVTTTSTTSNIQVVNSLAYVARTDWTDVVQAEDYDLGGSDYGAFYDITTIAASAVSGYRSDNTDTRPGPVGQNVQLQNASTGMIVGFTSVGEKLNYSIKDVPTGDIRFSVVYATPNATAQLKVTLNGTVLTTMALPSTTGWTIYRDAISDIISYTGDADNDDDVLTLEFVGSGSNIDFFSLAPAANLSVNINANSANFPICPTCDLTVNNGAVLTVDADRTYNTLTIAAGGRINNDNASATTLSITGDLTIESDASGTGTYVEKQNGALSVSGTTTVKQYLASDRNWYLSSAVSNAVAPSGIIYYKYLEAGNNPANPLVAPATLYWASVAAGETLNPAMGYIARPSAETTIALATTAGGSLNTGDMPTELLTRTPTVSKPGFNLVGNPYPSYLDMNSFATSEVIMPSLWFRSRNGSTWGFDTYNIPSELSTGASGLAVTNLVPPMQAFWVRLKPDVTSGTLTFTNNMRAHRDDANNKFRAPKATSTAQKVVRLQVSNGVNTDEAIVYFNQNASDSYDTYDSPKMLNDIATAPEIYTMVGAERLSINGLNSIPAESNVAIGLRKGTANQFTMRISELKNMDTDTRIILIDSKENEEHDITEGSVFSFESDEATSNSRFSLAFRSPSVTTGLQTANATKFSVKSMGNQLVINSKNARNAKVIIYNAVGQKLIETVNTGDSTVINHSLDAGVYIVSLEVAGTKRTEKIILN